MEGAADVRLTLAAMLGWTALLTFSGSCLSRELPRTEVHVGGYAFHAEIAADDASRTRGLMFRDELAEDAAMLFVFEAEQPLAFWMKNTRIPLDILYFDASGRLVSMQTEVPPCRVALCPNYPSERPARFVVEVIAGTAKRLGLKTGAALCWPPEFSAPLPACVEAVGES